MSIARGADTVTSKTDPPDGAREPRATSGGFSHALQLQILSTFNFKL